MICLPWNADRPAGALAIGSEIGSRASRCSTTDSALPSLPMVAGIRFIAGEPMKSATKMLVGLL